MKKFIYEIDSFGFIKEVHLGTFDSDGNLISHEGDFVTVDLPQPLLFYKPKWNGAEWIEGATQEEIDEMTKVEPQPPTEMELLKQRLMATENALAELILGGM